MQLTLKRIKLKYTGEELSAGFLRGNQYIEELTILDGFKEIPANAFRECPNLKKVEIQGESLKMIEGFCFTDCPKLTDVKLNDGLTEIGNWSFDSCNISDTLKLPKNIRLLGSGCFGRNKNLPAIDFNDGLKVIGAHCFRVCEKIESISIPESTTSLDRYCFSDCVGLKNIWLKEGLKEVGQDCFVNCTNVPEIIIPKSVINIDEGCFFGWKETQKIIIHNTETFVKEHWAEGWDNGCNAEIEFE
jgi:hypothetical protein